MKWPPQADGVLIPLQWHAFSFSPVLVSWWGTVKNRPTRLAKKGRRDPDGETGTPWIAIIGQDCEKTKYGSIRRSHFAL